MSVEWVALPGVEPDHLGESPLWHPGEGVLYWVDIPGRRLHRFDPRDQGHRLWHFDAEPGCIVPCTDGTLLMPCRDGLWRFDPAKGRRDLVCPPPYDPAGERFNDGKADPQGRLWVGTIHDHKQPRAALYRWDGDAFERVVDGATTSNGIAWSPDGRTLYWSDTPRHEVFAFDVDAATGALDRRRSFARFEPRDPARPIEHYGGRPDGAAVDVEGAYWVAMFEGARILRLSPTGDVLCEIALPVRCPTMPCLGGPDLRTLYVTSARAHRPPQELSATPLAGCVLQFRVDVPGLPVNFMQG